MLKFLFSIHKCMFKLQDRKVMRTTHWKVSFILLSLNFFLDQHCSIKDCSRQVWPRFYREEKGCPWGIPNCVFIALNLKKVRLIIICLTTTSSSSLSITYLSGLEIPLEMCCSSSAVVGSHIHQFFPPGTIKYSYYVIFSPVSYFKVL